ncbi:MAG TPA: zinc ribbon domain-containing protein [Xanthobacteraceae bacterium]|nr:zinc ribbon domain-containing protein [Xanthobacteraceae bacterium]
MPVYDYECESCGPFTFMRPMAQCDRPARCPQCGGKAPRAFLTAPYFAMPAERRRAYAANEQSANAPYLASEVSGAHDAGCSCCVVPPTRTLPRSKGGKKSRTKTARSGAKSFPGSRPWMISH